MGEDSARELRRRTSRYRNLGVPPDIPESGQVGSKLAELLLSREPSRLPYVPVRSDRGRDLALDLLSLTTRENEDESECILLTGQRGVGKTSALQHFRDKVLAASDPKGVESRWIYVDGEHCAVQQGFDQQLLVQAILAQTAKAVDIYLERQGLSANDFIRESFNEDPLFGPDRLLDSEEPPERQVALVKEKFEDHLSYLEVCLRFLARRFGKGRVLLVLDNMDPFSFELQFGAIELAYRLAMRCNIQAITSVRRSTARRLRFVDPEGIMHSVQEIEARPPELIDVIRQCLEQIMRSEATGRDLAPDAEKILSGLSNSAVLSVLEPLSNGRVRDGLRLVAEILRSSTFISILLSGARCSQADVLRALLLGDREVYQPEKSLLDNIFGTSHSYSHLGPFLRAHVILLVRQHGEEGLEDERLLSQLRSVLDAGLDAVETEVLWLLDHDWLERPELGYLSATPRGRIFVEKFLFQMEYLINIASDIDMNPEAEGLLVFPAKGQVVVIRNLLTLLEYLVSREKEMFQHIGRDGLSDYIRIFGDQGLTFNMISRAIEAIGVPGETAEAAAARSARIRLAELQQEVDIPLYISVFGED
ncbi:MAG TPA: ATP-binding protein [Thermoanaerobaculia bacterium]